MPRFARAPKLLSEIKESLEWAGEIMFVMDMTISLAIGILLTVLFGAGLRLRGPWESLVVFFCLVSLSAWAGGSWLSPRGPVLWGVSWVPFLVIGGMTALFLAATPQRDTVAEQKVESKGEKLILGNLFWILIGVLGAMIVAHYRYRRG